MGGHRPAARPTGRCREQRGAAARRGLLHLLYWITKGHEDDNERWSYLAMVDALMPHGRGFVEREHVYTAFHCYRFGLVRDTGPMKPHLALDAPFAGLVVEVIDAPSVENRRLNEQQRTATSRQVSSAR